MTDVREMTISVLCEKYGMSREQAALYADAADVIITNALEELCKK